MAKKRVLIIDDADLFREIMSDLLSERGLEVAVAKDGIEGLDKIKRHAYDLVVLDLLIPKMTGFDVLKEIRKDKVLAGLPVLAVSGVFKKDEHMASLKDLGATGYISKSLSPAEIADRIARSVEEEEAKAQPVVQDKAEPALVPERMKLFKELGPEQMERITKISRRSRFSRGQVIIREGDLGNKFYGLVSGTVRVEKKGPSGEAAVIARLSPGAEFGELALLDKERRSATCVAETEVETLEIARPDFERALAEDPELERKCLRALLGILTDRLRETDQSLTFSRALLDKVIEPGK